MACWRAQGGSPPRAHGTFLNLRKQHVIHWNAHASTLIIFRWSARCARSRANICVSRVPCTRCFSIIVVWHSYRSIRIDAARCSQMQRCILPTAPCHVTFNPMAFFPVIRSSRRIKRTFFPFSFILPIYIYTRVCV